LGEPSHDLLYDPSKASQLLAAFNLALGFAGLDTTARQRPTAETVIVGFAGVRL
jgi:hypothetical protein